MEQTFRATENNAGFHPAGYRIDKTASTIKARYYGKETRLGEVAKSKETGYFLVK